MSKHKRTALRFFACTLWPLAKRGFVVFGISLLLLPLFFLTRGGAGVPHAYAATSDNLNFQARLQTAAGSIATDGYYNVEFKLYDAASGGTLLWTETRDYNGGSPDNRVRVANGYLTVNLGDVTSFPGTMPWDQQLYLTMNIGGTGTSASWDGEMDPRLKLTAVPYAFNAKTASQLVTTSGALSGTLSIQAPTVGSQIFQLTDQGAAGTYNILVAPSGSDGYVKLQSSTPGTQQTGNLNISGAGIFGGVLQGGTLQAGATQQFQVDASGNVTTSGSVSVGTNSLLTVGGATLNNTLAISDLPTGGNIGTAAATVDIYTNFTVTQTTAGQTLTIPAPTSTTSGRLIYITNVGSAGYTIGGSIASPGTTMAFVWNSTTSAWTLVSSGTTGNYIQNGTAIQTANFNIQSNSTTSVTATIQGANSQSANILEVKAAGVGTPLFSVGPTTINAGEDMVIAAGKSVTITGGNTASRPASPTEGMLYYDTDTHQLLIYNGSKWKADGSDAVLVAANDSSAADKAAADYIADGTADESEINTALTAAASTGTRKTGRVFLFAGTYNVVSAVSVPNNVTLAGAGSGTTLKQPDSNNGTYSMVTNADTSTGTGITIRDLVVDGNKANQASGQMIGIILDHMGGGTGTSARTGAHITNVTIKNLKGTGGAGNGVGLRMTTSSNNTIVDNKLENNNYYGMYINSSSSYNTFANNLIQGSGNSGAGGGVFVGSSSNTFTGNTFEGNITDGIIVSTGHYTLITGNTFANNTGSGINVTGSDYVTVSGNDTQNNTGSGIIVDSSDYASVTGNNVANNASTNGGIYVHTTNHVTVSGNTLHHNQVGIFESGAADGAISGNTIDDSYNTTNGYGIYLVANANRNQITGNKVIDSGGAVKNNGIYINNADDNSVTSNSVSDSGGHSSSNDAIYMESTANRTYLSGNTIYDSGAITDAASDTIYGGQISGVSGTGSYTIQNAGGVAIASTAGTSSNNITLNTGNASAGNSGSITLDVGTATGTKGSITLGGTNAITIGIGNASATTTIQGNLGVTLNATTGTTMVCRNASGYLSACDASYLTPTATNFIQNQNASQQTGNYWISGTARADTSVLTPLLDTATAVALNIGTTNATAINLNQDTVVAAGKNIRITGGNTASRPASPAAGMLYYDTDTNQLLTYNGSKWKADGSDAVLVAANDSSAADKAAADYIADGTADESEINTALTAASSSGTRKTGKVYLFAGTYTAAATILVPNNVMLAGAGSGTVIQLADLDASDNLIENSDKTTGAGVVIRDLKIDGRNNLNTAGTQYGIYFDQIGDASATAYRNGALVTNIEAVRFRDFAFYAQNSADVKYVHNIAENNTGGGFYVTGSFFSTVTGNSVKDSTAGVGIYLTNGGLNTVSGNTLLANATGIRLGDILGATVSGNNLYGNTTYGIYLNGGNNLVVSDNNIQENGDTTDNNSIYIASSTSNTISGNMISDSAHSGSNNGIVITGGGAATGNQLSDNMLNGSAVSDGGTGTVFSGQSNGTAYLLQPGTNITVGSASTTTTIQGNTAVTLNATTGTTMVCRNASGYLSACDVSATSGFIQNQNSAQQTSSNYWISGTGRADTSFLTPLVDATAASGTLGIGTTNATTLNIGNTSNATQVSISGGNGASAISLQTAASGTINVGSQSAVNTINVGVVGSANVNSTVNIASSSAGVQTVTIGSVNSTSTTNIRSGSGGINLSGNTNINTTGTGTTSIGSAAGGAVAIAANAASSFTTNTGALTLTSAAATTWSTTAGALTLQGAAGATITSAASTVTSDVTISTGNASAGASGNISVDTGTATTTAGTISIGTTNASAVTIGRATVTTTIAGNTAVTLSGTTGTTLVCQNGSSVLSACDASYLAPTATSFIQNGTSQQASADFNIDGTGTADTLVAVTAVQAPLLDTATAVALNIGTTNATAINLNQDTVVAAGKNIRITGGNTASRPATPAAGMLYYDTDTNQLLTYNGSKWKADGSDAVLVAANDSSAADKAAADYIADGTADESEINTALTAASSSGTRKTGKVYLFGGTYTIAASVSIPNNVTLAGAGRGTLITVANSFNTSIDAITNTTTGGSGTGIVIQDLRLDGNRSNQASGTMRGIYLNGVGSGTGSSAVQGAKITNVWSNNWNDAGFYFTAQNSTFTGNSAVNNSNGFVLGTAARTVFTNNVSQGNTNNGFVIGFSSLNSYSNNIAETNGSAGFSLNSSNYNTFASNQSVANVYGFAMNTADNNSITGNTVQGNTTYGISMSTGSDNNSVANNNMYDTGGATANNAIYIDSSNYNSISVNDITDSSATTTNYPININSGTGTYLANNYNTSGAIRDNGTSTVYGGQSNSSSVYAIQNAGGVTLGSLGGTTSNGVTISTGNASAGASGNVSIDTGTATTTTGTISIGTANASLVTIGNTTGTNAVTIQSGTGALALQSQGTINIGANAVAQTITIGNTTGATALNLTAGSGNINLQANTVLASGKTIRVTGDTYTNISGYSSPSAGTMTYDTTNNQLLVYNGSKWKADGNDAVLVAASNSSQADKNAADYVSDGTNDESEINTALTAASSSGTRKTGKVYLFGGTYNISGSGSAIISVPDGVTLAGSGYGTLLQLGNVAGSTRYMITNSNTTDSTGIVIRDMRLDGAKATNTSGTQYGVYLNGLGNSSTGVEGATVTGLWVTNVRSGGIYLTSANYSQVVNNYLYANNYSGGGSAIYMNGNRNSVINNNVHNNLNYGIILNGVGYSVINSNQIHNNTSRAIDISGNSSANTINSNNFRNNGGATTTDAIYIASSTANTITSNVFSDANCSTTCYAINISDSGSTGTYIADNTFGVFAGSAPYIYAASGSNPTYGGQLNSDGASTFAIQNAGALSFTTAAAATSSAITIQTGNSTAGTAASVTIDTGTSTSGSGSINIGTTNAGTVTIGKSSGTTAIQSDTITIGSATGATTFQKATQTTSNTAGAALTIQGATGNGSGAGGNVSITAGSGGATSGANGGTLALSGGAATGTGTMGLITLNPTAFIGTSQNCTVASCSITAASVNTNSTILVNNTYAGSTVALADPTLTTAGRVLYVTNSGTQDMTLSVNGGGTGNTIALKMNTTATMFWNGADWTAAGASSATDLQAAYNNTQSTAGGAEIVLAAAAGNSEGLTIRNNGTTPITGALFEVQSSIAANLFSVNNNTTEYAVNGGAENSTFTGWGNYNSGVAAKTTTSGQFATGVAGVSVTVAGTNRGAKNTLSTTMSAGVYVVSFAAKTSSGTNTFNAWFSSDGSAQTATCDSSLAGSGYTITQNFSVTTSWTKVSCFVTVPAGATSANAILIANQSATNFYIDNLSVVSNAASSTPANVQIGGGATGGQPTLFTLDQFAGPPMTTDNPAYYGSMYYDTTKNAIQCYQASTGWGACGSAPDNIVTLTPEYANAVLAAPGTLGGVATTTGVGTLTADFCSNESGVLQVNTSFCASHISRNYYRWTSPQATAQTYSIYVQYKLPSTFKGFYDDNTIKLSGYRDNATDSNANLQLSVFRSTGSAITQCGSTTDVTNSSATWETTSLGGTGETNCSFTGGDYIVFKIDVTASNNYNVYVENLEFRYTNK